MIGLRFVVIVQVDGLNEEEFKKELSHYGKVWRVEDDELGENTPVKKFFVDSDFGKYFVFKLDYNCVEPRQYVLFPMASFEDKIKMQKELRV